MHCFQITPIPTEVAEAVRSTGKAPQYGFPAHKEIAGGRAPCRHCLRLIRIHEEQLFLFTYDPFENVGAPPLPGPVYIHADHCERTVGATVFPEEYRGRALTFAAYGDDRALLAEVRLNNGKEEEEAGKLFANPGVKYIHSAARRPAVTCSASIAPKLDHLADTARGEGSLFKPRCRKKSERGQILV